MQSPRSRRILENIEKGKRRAKINEQIDYAMASLIFTHLVAGLVLFQYKPAAAGFVICSFMMFLFLLLIWHAREITK